MSPELAGGVRSSISYPAEVGLSAERLRTSYDGIANLASMAGTNSYVLARYTAIGQPGQYARNGTTSLFTSYGYDIATGAVADIQQPADTGVTSTSLGDAVYSYDNAGQVTSIATSSNTTAADTQCFEYDHLQDLTSAWTPADNNCATARSSGNLGGPAPYWTDYSVDAATGNRLSTTENPVTAGGTSTTDTYAYPVAAAAHPHAVQSVTYAGGATGSDSYLYDASGDTTSRPGQTLTYDSAGRLSTVTAGSDTQSLVYDASGSLLLQSDPVSGSTLYLGDTELHVAAGSSTVTAVRTYSANGTPIAERTTTAGVSGSVVKWLGTDAQNRIAPVYGGSQSIAAWMRRSSSSSSASASDAAQTRFFLRPVISSMNPACVSRSSARYA